MEPTNEAGASGAKSMTLYYAIGGLIVLGGVAYLFLGGNAAVPTTNSSKTDDDAKKEVAAPAEKKSLRALLGMSESVTCAFAADDPQAGKSSGTVYVAGGKMRGDFTAVLPTGGKKVESHMIVDGDMTYIWSPEGMGRGMKMRMPAVSAEPGANAAAEPAEGAPSWDAAYDYRCSAWTPDSAKFTPPSDVEFMDMEAMMKDMGGMKMPM